MQIEYGHTKNGIPFAKFGSGTKVMLVWLGGPGNNLAKGMEFRVYSKGFLPFALEYTIYLLTRKSNLPQKYSMQDMSNDYADMIQTEFQGKVAVIVSLSYGSMIAQHFLADHPNLFGVFIMAMSAHIMTETGKAADVKYAQYMSQGKIRKALLEMAPVLVPSNKSCWFYKLFFGIFGNLIHMDVSPTFASDILIEAQAEMENQTVQKLPQIRVPVLIISGDQDFYHPKQDIEEMAKMIPNAQLILYPGKGHLIMGEKRFAKDIQNFIIQITQKTKF